LIVLLLVAAKCLFVVAMVVGVCVPFLAWLDRKQGALMQDRVGGNRAASGGVTLMGLLDPLADLVKVPTKEHVVPTGANRVIHTLAPLIAVVPAVAAFAVIPYGGVYTFGRSTVSLVVADIDWGVFYIFALGSIAAYGAVLAGWSSNNHGSLLSGVRAAAQTISYEVTMGLSIVGIFMLFGTLKLTDIAAAQDSTVRILGFVEAFGWILPEWASRFPFTFPNWGIVLQPIGFVMFLTCSMARNRRPPFELSEAGSGLGAGYLTEYAGMRFALFRLAEFVEMAVIAGLTTSLFLGGWTVPWLSTDQIIGLIAPLLGDGFANAVCLLAQVAMFTAKVAGMIWLQMRIRWSLPRFRYDQLMNLCWKVILPLSIVNIFATAGVLVLLGEVG